MAFFWADKARQQHFAHLQARHVIAVATKNDVGAAASHIGGDGDRTSPSGLSNDFCFPLHILGFGIEQVVGNALLVEQ